MSDAGGASLFDEAPAGSDGRRLLFATNRFNLLEIFSSGLIAPLAAYDKYYDDYLARAPGRIVLFAESLPAESVATVSAESPASFPVALELDPSALTAAEVPALTSKGEAKLPLNVDGALAWAPASAIPTRAVTAIHFRSQDELREHQARDYPNVRIEDPVLITPELFSGDQRPELEDWLDTLPRVASPTDEDFERVDRLTGALALLASELPGSRAAFENYVALVNGVIKKKRARARAGDALPAWLTRPFTGTVTRSPDADDLFYAAAWAVLHAYRPSERWRPLEILAAIRQQLPRGKHDDVLDGAVSGIDRILRNEVEFRPFTPGRGLDSAKALLLVLLRPEPDRLSAWTSDETGADETVRAAAAALSGLLTGRKRLSLTRRPQGLDEMLAAVEPALLEMPDELTSPAVTDLKVEERSGPSGRELALSVGGIAQITQKAGHAPLAARLSESQLNPGDEDYEEALQIAVALGWEDAVTTVVYVEQGFSAVPNDQGLELRVTGIPKLSHELNADAFRRWLASASIPDDLASKLDNDATYSKKGES